MVMNLQIEYESINKLLLDPFNPRLGRRKEGVTLSQGDILELMKDWSLEELALSFLENGFWPQEALVVIMKKINGDESLLVIEGNRRLAALKNLKSSINGGPINKKWKEIVGSKDVPPKLFQKIPYILVDSRKEVEAYLGFRHVTGIKQWRPTEKAEFISRLIENNDMTYQEVMRQIGSKTEAVRRNYISYRVFKQMEDLDKSISLKHVEDKFSVLFLSLRESGVRKFLDIDILSDPSSAKSPVPNDHLDNLASFASWLFGTNDDPPLLTDSRYVNKFSKILESPKAVLYLKDTKDPTFEMAVQKSGADEPELLERIQRATDEIEQTLGRIHLHLESPEIQKSVKRFASGAVELINKFSNLFKKLNLKKK